MSFQSSRQEILHGAKTIKNEWKSVRENWQDKKAEEFERTYIARLEREVKTALAAMDEIDELFKEIQKDCF